ncbi:AraC family transcriptional regulator [Streptomyces sp. NPDC026673]|uniref:AraC family transcriptional regulator n=1 Tax=Streptomyces sp. NPDC026673 TaxID=3155724 RepID=UPI0033D9383A
MDTLSRVVQMARLRGTVDIRCMVAGRHTLDNPEGGNGRSPFHLLLAGECTLELPDRRIALRAGDFVLLPRGTAHRVHTRGPDPDEPIERRDLGPYALLRGIRAEDTPVRGAAVDLFCGHYTWGPGAGQVLMGMLPDVLHVPLGTDAGGPLPLLGAFMRDEARTVGPGTEAVLDSLCDVLLTMALRSVSGVGRAAWLASTRGVVRTVTDAVVRDPAHDWGIEKFAALNSMSRATFIRHFGRETGMNAGEFLTRLRMLLAAELLTETEQPVAAVAAAVGYGSESAFGRAFRLAAGDTPARLRRAARQAVRGEGVSVLRLGPADGGEPSPG